MKKDFIYSIIRGALVLLIGFALLYILWSMKNVVLTLTGDGMRVFVIIAAYALSIPLYLQYAMFAVKKKDTLLLSLSAGAGIIALVIGGAFVLVDYSMNLFNTFDSIDTRLKSAIEVSIWIVCSVLLACNFALAIAFKKLYPKLGVPTGILINELLASVFCIWGNAWGTADAVYTLTQDTFSAVGMAITLDFMILVTGAWYIVANDSATEKITLVIASVGLVVTSVMQVLDGYLRGGGVQVEDEMKNLFQFGFPVILLGSVVALVATGFVDYWNGGFSFVKSEDEPKRENNHKDNVMSSERGGGNFKVSRPPQAQLTEKAGQGGSPHGKKEFAEPGGLPEGLVEHLKRIGYSGNVIRKMTLAEARIAAKKPLNTPQSANGAEPKEQPESFN